MVIYTRTWRRSPPTTTSSGSWRKGCANAWPSAPTHLCWPTRTPWRSASARSSPRTPRSPTSTSSPTPARSPSRPWPPAWSSASKARSSTRSRRRWAGPRRWSARHRYRPRPSPTYATICATRRCRTSARTSCSKVGRRLARPKLEGESWIRMTALGGYREVGRSASLLSTRESKVLIDCGIDASDSGKPYLRRAGDPALGPPRRHRHHPCPSGPLRPVAGAVQVRV